MDRAGYHALASRMSREPCRIVDGQPVEILRALEVEPPAKRDPMRVRVPYQPGEQS
jgi:hypothetical protein